MPASAMESLLWAQTEESVRLVSVARGRLDDGAFDVIGDGMRNAPAFASRAAS
jgi:hypothetical protein